MPVVEAVQTFVGIVNENEFYSHHYLSEVFKGDIRERLEQWAAAEEADPAQRAPYKRLASLSGQWFALAQCRQSRVEMPRSSSTASRRCSRDCSRPWDTPSPPNTWNCRPACRCRCGR